MYPESDSNPMINTQTIFPIKKLLPKEITSQNTFINLIS
jgi:hypothetical protein